METLFQQPQPSAGAGSEISIPKGRHTTPQTVRLVPALTGAGSSINGNATPQPCAQAQTNGRTSNPVSDRYLPLPILGVGRDELVRIHVLGIEFALYEPPLGQHIQYVLPTGVAHMADPLFGGQRT